MWCWSEPGWSICFRFLHHDMLLLRPSAVASHSSHCTVSFCSSTSCPFLLSLSTALNARWLVAPALPRTTNRRSPSLLATIRIRIRIRGVHRARTHRHRHSNSRRLRERHGMPRPSRPIKITRRAHHPVTRAPWSIWRLRSSTRASTCCTTTSRTTRSCSTRVR